MSERTTWVELLGVTLSGAEEPDSGLIWSNLEGWWGLPDARGDGDPIPGGHGRFRRSAIFRASRVITLTGHIYATDPLELVAVRDRLEAALAAGSGAMRVGTPAGIWERWVEIDTLKIEPDRGRRWTQFTVDMIAPDPRRYGPWQTLGPVGLPVREGGLTFPRPFPWSFGAVAGGGALIVSNTGTISANPVFRVTGGGMSRLLVTDLTTGDRLLLDRPVPVGAEVRFDCAARRAWADGQEVTRWLLHRQWVEIPAGETHEFRFEASGGADPLLSADFRIGAW